MDEQSVSDIFLSLVSTPDEFEAIINPITAEDHLLRMQADAITDHVRIYRVMLARRERYKQESLLLESHRKDFLDYLSYLPEQTRVLCEYIPTRYILTNNYDAMCFKTDRGRVIVVSEVLRYFLYFMNLATLDLGAEIPSRVRFSASLIAVRTMLLTESLDFDIDPRGVVPDEIHSQLEAMVSWQMKFVIGHEYAHHVLGHNLDGRAYVSANKRSSNLGKPLSHSGCSRSHADEFSADLHSISSVSDNGVRYSLFIGGTSFLLNLYVFEMLAEKLEPNFPELDTHPNTSERFGRLVEHFRDNPRFMIEGVENVASFFDRTVDNLLNYNLANPNAFSTYGSVYLDEWRGPVLHDRVDF